MTSRNRLLSLGFWAGLSAAATSGCAENAILELQIALPARPTFALPVDGEAWFVQTQLRDGTFSLEEPWGGAEIPTVALEDEATFDCISVESGDESLDLLVKVRLCATEFCNDIPDSGLPEVWTRIEHPFYIGRRTYYRLTIDPFVQMCATDDECGEDATCDEGTCRQEVGKCEVAGCITGSESGFCRMGTTTHFCESMPDRERSVSNCELP